MIEQIQRVIANIVERVGTQGAAKESLGTVPASLILQRSLGLIETALVISYIQGRPMIIAGVQIIIHGRNF